MIAIDPGKRSSGVAMFDSKGTLVRAFLTNKAQTKAPRSVDWMLSVSDFTIEPLEEVIIEMPKVYPGAARTDLNDLLDLAAVVGAHALRAYRQQASVTLVHPQDWKGQVPKKIMNARVLSRLTEAEQATIEGAGAKTHNVLDAIGIGLRHLNRL